MSIWPLGSSTRLVKLDHKPNPSLAYTDVLVFRWDPRKAAANYKKHAIDFHEAATVLDDTLSTTFPDFDHSTPLEPRFLTIGMSSRGRILVVAHSEETDTVRLISARTATRHERRFYEEG
jgi:uncharacterized protein